MKIFGNEVSTVDLITGAVKLVTTAGVVVVAHSIIENNTSPAETKMDTVKIWAGTYVIVSLVVEHTSAHVERQITEATDTIRSIKAEYKKIAEAEK